MDSAGIDSVEKSKLLDFHDACYIYLKPFGRTHIIILAESSLHVKGGKYAAQV